MTVHSLGRPEGNKRVDGPIHTYIGLTPSLYSIALDVNLNLVCEATVRNGIRRRPGRAGNLSNTSVPIFFNFPLAIDLDVVYNA